MNKNFLILSTLSLLFVSQGLPREISYNEVWKGDQFLSIPERPNKIQEVKKPVSFPAIKDGQISVEELKKVFTEFQNSKLGKQQDPRDLVTDILCWLFGCQVATTAPPTITSTTNTPSTTLTTTTTSAATTTTSTTTPTTTTSTTTPTTTTSTTTPTTTMSTTRTSTATTPTSTSTTTSPSTTQSTTQSQTLSTGGTVCTPLQVITQNCIIGSSTASGGGGGNTGGSTSSSSVTGITNTTPTANTNTTPSFPTTIPTNGNGFFNGTLEYADSLNISMITRTRRPPQFKIGNNCKNKPTKLSQEIEDEDALELSG